ncbi:hypothetical protein BDZ89DRAFT_1055437 [Hymenopellis radicata]|nr:hypothetical protein BDZ89DRAFT_1055437 [Hymenopellis radicata]
MPSYHTVLPKCANGAKYAPAFANGRSSSALPIAKQTEGFSKVPKTVANSHSLAFRSRYAKLSYGPAQAKQTEGFSKAPKTVANSHSLAFRSRYAKLSYGPAQFRSAYSQADRRASSKKVLASTRLLFALAMPSYHTVLPKCANGAKYAPSFANGRSSSALPIAKQTEGFSKAPKTVANSYRLVLNLSSLALACFRSRYAKLSYGPANKFVVASTRLLFALAMPSYHTVLPKCANGAKYAPAFANGRSSSALPIAKQTEGFSKVPKTVANSVLQACTKFVVASTRLLFALAMPSYHTVLPKCANGAKYAPAFANGRSSSALPIHIRLLLWACSKFVVASTRLLFALAMPSYHTVLPKCANGAKYAPAFANGRSSSALPIAKQTEGFSKVPKTVANSVLQACTKFVVASTRLLFALAMPSYHTVLPKCANGAKYAPSFANGRSSSALPIAKQTEGFSKAPKTVANSVLQACTKFVVASTRLLFALAMPSYHTVLPKCANGAKCALSFANGRSSSALPIAKQTELSYGPAQVCKRCQICSILCNGRSSSALPIAKQTEGFFKGSEDSGELGLCASDVVQRQTMMEA